MLGFDKPKEGDISYQIEGITVHVEKKQTMYLVGLEVDFYEGNDAREEVWSAERLNQAPYSSLGSPAEVEDRSAVLSGRFQPVDRRTTAG